MHAIIETGGKQYRVAPGDVSAWKNWPAMSARKSNSLLRPRSKKAASWCRGKVKGTIVGGRRADKIIVFKFKRKKQYKKTIGHRQSFTEVKVGDDSGVGDEWHIKKA